MKRIVGLIFLISIVVIACQAVQSTTFRVDPLMLWIQTTEPELQPVATEQTTIRLYPPPQPIDRYPSDGVRGLYLTANGATHDGISSQAKKLLAESSLNAVVIDYKDDWGRIAAQHGSHDSLLQSATRSIYSASELVSQYHDLDVYTIARIVCFKDTFRAEAMPEEALRLPDGSLWYNSSGDAFLNPFHRSNWDYLVEAAIEAAKAGFDEIQFDYVRFPENFNYLSQVLVFSQEAYENLALSEEAKRSLVIADFIGYAREKLEPHNVRLSADIFGYVTMVVDDGNIGQNFLQIAQHVDVISSMIYPSHWSDGSFGAAKPDLEPGKVVSGYIARELELLAQLEQPPITRPWLQSFTANYLGDGNFVPYTATQVQEQIDALRDAGVNEYLLWDPANNYLPDVNY